LLAALPLGGKDEAAEGFGLDAELLPGALQRPVGDAREPE
jgi:hypothetical protein